MPNPNTPDGLDDPPAGPAALLREMVRIRCVEEELADLYRDEQEMRTPVHFSVGQEAAAVGVCTALRADDLVYTGHRSHAAYLAKGGDLAGMVAELYGKETGCSRGRGGSVHLSDRAVGFAGSAAILGEMISVATGAAWALSREGTSRVVSTFFGDGASEEGVLHESLNFAAVHRIPIVFVCENNSYSISSPLSARQPARSATTGITERAQAFGIAAERLDGNDVRAVHEAALRAAAHCRAGLGPYFLELDTYRWREHVGPNWDNGIDRPGDEVEAWQERCPIRRTARELGGAAPDIERQLLDWDEEFRDLTRLAVTAAKAAPYPDVDRLTDGAYGRPYGAS
ncbi:thiamine pyrophosphate-dependent dehydrogenase E1 component subunit alpha [Streptomyces sp. NPDC048442]|uniref:thiamine pyrophosphate-dependent dehydrogenase E1 component subunit alpha n=1 Tax=Streptomyces sp. NPDC048442 TaxID=3154823 RepID=UPI003431A32E